MEPAVARTLLSDLTCVLCLGTLKDPVAFPACGHLFCHGCHIRLVSRTPHNRTAKVIAVQCPYNCGSSIVPAGGLAKLRYLQGVIDQLSSATTDCDAADVSAEVEADDAHFRQLPCSETTDDDVDVVSMEVEEVFPRFRQHPTLPSVHRASTLTARFANSASSLSSTDSLTTQLQDGNYQWRARRMSSDSLIVLVSGVLPPHVAERRSSTSRSLVRRLLGGIRKRFLPSNR